jgi:flagellar M-ring protein FliF
MRLLTTRLAPAGAAGRRASDVVLPAPAGGAVAQPATLEPGLAAPALPGASTGAGTMPVVPLLENYDLPPTGSSVDVMVDHLKVLAEKEPERVAEVVKQWMQKNGRRQ